MVALLRHFLAGSLLLLAVFTPSVNAKAKCTQGGVCFGKQEVPKAGYSYDMIFKPTECEDKCYRFFCLANGGLNAGVGCKEDVKKHCSKYADKIFKGEVNEKNWILDGGFGVNPCTDDSCQIKDLDYYWATVKEFYKVSEKFLTQVTVDTCEYNPPPPPSAVMGSGTSNGGTGISSVTVVYGTSMIILGSLVAEWFLALRLW